MSSLGVLEQKENPDASPQIARLSWGSLILQNQHTLQDQLTNQCLPSVFLDTKKTSRWPRDVSKGARRSQDPPYAALSSLRNTRVRLGGGIGGACPSEI